MKRQIWLPDSKGSKHLVDLSLPPPSGPLRAQPADPVLAEAAVHLAEDQGYAWFLPRRENEERKR